CHRSSIGGATGPVATGDDPSVRIGWSRRLRLSPRRGAVTHRPGGFVLSTGADHLSAEQLPHRVEDSLRQFFTSRSDLVDSVGGGYRQAVDTLEAFVLRGGKRVRPRFAWTGWLGAGGDPTGPDAAAVLQACSALELVQAAALVHDDIIDASTTRRGFPTVHVEFTEQHRSAGW